ncbi:MAG: NAD(P)H-hydrate dehydratase [Chloroflexi bacterium]|nr:NAD(P)H-hydrate dehydratase [Chloroflexota bacterium]
MPEPFPIVSVAEMRALEAAAVEAGTPERVLQERAGLAVADAVEAELVAAGRDAARRPRIVVLVGAGNNGRDAVVAGRRLAARGGRVSLWWGSRCPLSQAERIDLAAEGLRFARFDEEGFAPHLATEVEASDVVIDGLLGVGSRGPMRPELARVAGVANAARGRTEGRRAVAVDVPSGIDADDGSTPGTVVRADLTVTFGAVKTGLLRFPAAGHAGRIIPARIGLPSTVVSAHSLRALDVPSVRGLAPARAADAHKYRVGRVLVIAGSDQYVGAACLASEAAARAGAGLVGLASTEAVKRVLATRLPEATYPLTLADLAHRTDAEAAAVVEVLADQEALAIGPGIGRAPATAAFLRAVLTGNAAQPAPTPCVIDADALSLLAQWPDWWQQIGREHVLTPHAGEMARLLDGTPQLDRVDGEATWETARRAAQHWGQIVVLKGPFTTVALPDGSAWVWPHANAALATAGTGDVLAGLTASLLAQGLTPSAAARLGVVVHALAARRAADRLGTRTLLASDLPAALPAVLADLESPRPFV